MPATAAILRQKLSMCHDASLPARARAETLALIAAEMPLDVIEPLTEVVALADFGRQKMHEAEEQDRSPLVRATYLGPCALAGKLYAAIAGPQGENYLPALAEQIDGLKMGDAILIDPKSARVVGTDGQVQAGGEVVTVEAHHAADPQRVVVKRHEQSLLARLSHRVTAERSTLEPGQRVLLDPTTQVVHELVETESDGEELVTSAESLARIDVSELAAANTVIEELFFRLKQHILHPEWTALLKPKEASSYLLYGPTGTGKTFHIRVVARLLMDFLEELTGERVSPLIVADTSTFFSPLFGQTEINIKAFFRKLRKVGGRTLTTHDGRTFRQPWLLVLEECESLFRSRGEQGGSSHLFDRPLALLLAELSSVSAEIDAPIVTLATTNMGHLIDPAALRRIGVRRVLFGPLTAGQADAILSRKLAAGLPFRTGEGEAARQQIVNQVLAFLYGGDDAAQALAEVRFIDASRRLVCRKHVVTGAVLDEAVNAAKDACLRLSAERGELIGLDAAGIIRSLHDQFCGLAATLKPHNIAEHCPQWFQDEPVRVESVKPLLTRSRRAAQTWID